MAELSLHELQIRRAQIRIEFDHLVWQHWLNSQQLDRMAKELDDLATEIAAEKIRREVPPEWAERVPLRMEFV
jgi:hypothetical protein